METKLNYLKFDRRHGGPFDRGSADSWYSRDIQPHYYIGKTGMSPRVECVEGTEEYEAYMAGYEYNEQFGGKKDYV